MGIEGNRLVKVSLIQQGPATECKEENIKALLEKIDQVAENERPDFLMPTELSTTQYFPAGASNQKYFDWAEPIPGPITKLVGEKAKEYEMCVVLPMFERSSIKGIYYNSAVVIGPNGEIVEGIMPDGSRVLRHAKNHIPYMPSLSNRYDERSYFKEGAGFPVFDTPKAKIGIVICFERRFPESFRMIALQGAEIAFVPVCSFVLPPRSGDYVLAPESGGASAEEMYTPELRTRALENCMWVCSANRVGVEEVEDQKTRFYGLSSMIHPAGKVVIQASSTQPEEISYELDLEENNRVRQSLPTYKVRRPEIYTLINKPIFREDILNLVEIGE